MVSQEELALNDDCVNKNNIAEKIERLRKDLKNDHFGGEDTSGLHLSKQEFLKKASVQTVKNVLRANREYVQSVKIYKEIFGKKDSDYVLALKNERKYSRHKSVDQRFQAEVASNYLKKRSFLAEMREKEEKIIDNFESKRLLRLSSPTKSAKKCSLQNRRTSVICKPNESLNKTDFILPIGDIIKVEDIIPKKKKKKSIYDYVPQGLDDLENSEQKKPEKFGLLG